MNRKTISLFAIAITLVATIIWLLSAPAECTPSTVTKVVKKSPTPINMLITNEMSNLETTRSFDKSIEQFMRRWELTGGSFALMRNDSLIYAKGYGYADKRKGEMCDVKHVFRIASASKLITATAIMRLVEQNKLALTDKVFGKDGILCDTSFLNIRDKRMERITVEHLMRHTSGILPPIQDPAFGTYTVAQSIDAKLPLTADDLILYATRYRLRSMPGDRYRYSNLGYIILGKVIERVAGCSYENYVKTNILEPAGCYNMFIGRNFSKNRAPNEVRYYEVKEAEEVEAYDGSGHMTMKSDGGNDVNLLSSAGGWVASSVELLRFVTSINGNKSKSDILTKESVEAMTYDSKRYKPMGWASVRGREWLRSGSMAGTTTLIKQQKDGYTWVFVTNSSAWIGYHLSDRISSHISRAVGRVKEWPQRDLFSIKEREMTEILSSFVTNERYNKAETLLE